MPFIYAIFFQHIIKDYIRKRGERFCHYMVTLKEWWAIMN
nr:MAG TPA: hypothetical protein [Caudoviricetes sp.]